MPRIDLQLGGAFRSDAGQELTATFVATNAYLASASTLGRPLSGIITVPVNMIEPGTLFGERVNQVDVRVGRPFRLGAMRHTFALDLYNALNNDSFLGQLIDDRLVAGPREVTLPPRVAKISYTLDF